MNILSLLLDKWKSNNFIMGYYDNYCLIIEICVKRFKKKEGGLLCEMLLLDFHLSIYRLRIFMCLTIDVGFSIVSLWMGANQSGVNKLL